MSDPIADKPMRFLSFADDKEDAEKEAKLKEAAKKIEEAITREKSISELIDYVGPTDTGSVDAANDTRSLYERLQEQKNKKKEIEEESQKPSNFVSVLDEEEVDYLNEVERRRREEELKKKLEVYDALESKKRLDKQKAIDEEKRRKELLLGSTLNRKESQIKNRLSSMIKMKTRSKSSASKDRDSSGGCSNETTGHTSKRAISPDRKAESFKIKRLLERDLKESESKVEPSAKKDQPTNTKDDHAEKCDKSKECLCNKDLMKCIGVLPSLPLVPSERDSSDESDKSDDDLEQRLVPRIRRR